MYLKSIELQGFKSFARKTRLEFDPGLTGIVGPNGSGKSNIADAVRWVLGEQSAKQLRGANMQDVIFAGTENKKPVSFAYVCLTFDNADGALKDSPAEVSVARRVYRSGESEYLMNDAPCRMRDIVELFYDTGIGKEGYSIIGQGQVEKILNGKPEDRREMFDEAAGIMRYRKRREATRKKLESEQSSLSRVNDIISELERQVLPLEKQAGKARQFMKFKDELKTYDIQNFRIENVKYEQQLKETVDRLGIVCAELEASKNTSSELKASYEQAVEKQAELDQELDTRRSERDELSTRRESLEGNVRVLEEQIHSGELSSSQVESRREAIENRRLEIKNRQKLFQEEKGSLNAKLDHLDDKVTKSKEKHTAAERELNELKKSIADRQETILDLMAQKADVGARRQHFDTLRDQTLERKNRLVSDNAEAEKKINKEQSELDEWQKKLDALDDQLTKIREESDKNSEDVEKWSNNVLDLNQKYVKSVNQANTLKISLENLRNLAERYEGFGISVRKLMEAKGRFSGMVGTVAELITTDAKFELAVETALGGQLQNIVTETEADAKECIDYLKHGRFGRATFLPLDSINSRSFNRREALREEGVIGLASELVYVDAAYKHLADYLLGNVVVAENINCALSLARKFRHELRIVTLDGELLNRGGSITGGAYRNNSNLLGRNREIDELKISFEKARKECSEIELELNNAKEAQKAAKKERARLAEIREQCERNRIAVSKGLEAAADKNKDLLARSASYRDELAQIEGQLSQIESEGGLIDESVKESEDKRSALEKEIVSLNKKAEKLQEKCEELRLNTETLTVEFNNASQRDEFLLENLVRVSDDLKKLKVEEDEINAQAANYSQSSEDLKKMVEKTRAEIKEAADRLAKMDEGIAEKTVERDQNTESQKKFLAERDIITENMTRLNQEQFRLEVQKEKIEERTERATAYIWDEYELTPSEVNAVEPMADITSAEIKRKITELKSSIKQLGPVNVNAIDDFTELSERYHFMKGQQEDLFKAEDALRGVIEELDVGMRRQFTEKFEEIKSEFDKVFKELFGGGKAELELTDSDDVLDAGIQIIVQPPGKKLTNLMQMSGGEKALTAISILFAIQNLKPSPFCLLDEIEASLDDSNVDRFAEYLNKLGDRTQFITITHRRGTMTAAKRLYGITMQEKGISTLVSVDIV